MKKFWPIVGLILSLIISSISFYNYLNHRDAVNLIIGVEGAEADLLIVPEDSPMREVVERGSGISEEQIEARKRRIGEKKAKEAKSNSPFIKEVDDTNYLSDLDPVAIERTAPLSSYYYSLVDHLRLRATSDNTSEVLDHLHFGEQVEYMGEKTDQKESIPIGGKERNDYWYKVKAINSSRRVGWVYGGALLNASQEYSDELKGLVSPINFVYRDSVENLIGRDPYGNFNYSGLVSYKKDGSGAKQLDGRFYFEGFSEISYEGMTEYGDEGRLGGNFKAGVLHGDFKEVVGLFESSYELDIDYENGVCKSYDMILNAEGEISESKSDNPEECSFEFIQKKLRYVN